MDDGAVLFDLTIPRYVIRRGDDYEVDDDGLLVGDGWWSTTSRIALSDLGEGQSFILLGEPGIGKSTAIGHAVRTEPGVTFVALDEVATVEFSAPDSQRRSGQIRFTHWSLTGSTNVRSRQKPSPDMCSSESEMIRTSESSWVAVRPTGTSLWASPYARSSTIVLRSNCFPCRSTTSSDLRRIVDAMARHLFELSATVPPARSPASH